MKCGKSGLKKWSMLLLLIVMIAGTAFSSQAASKVATPKITSAKVSNGTIKLRWRKVSGITGYQIYVKTSENGKYFLLKTLGKNYAGLDCQDNYPGKYYFRIRAYKKSGKKVTYSSYSSTKSATVKGLNINLESMRLDSSIKGNLKAISKKIEKMKAKSSKTYPTAYYTGNNITLGANLKASYPKNPNVLYIKNSGNKRVSLQGIKLGMTVNQACNALNNQDLYFYYISSTKTFWFGNASRLELKLSNGKITGYTFVYAYTS